MVEIVKLGRDPNEEEVQGTCTRCGTVARWKLNDPEASTHEDQREGRYTQINCPVCAGFRHITVAL